MEQQEPIDAIHLTKKLLELTTSTWVDAQEFQAICNLTQIPPGEAKVDFLQRLLALIKRMPEKLLDKETKAKIIEAGQEYLDQAIDEEEELLEEEEDL